MKANRALRCTRVTHTLCLLALWLSLLPSAMAQAPATIAATWKLNGNGYPGDLVVTQAADGRISGTVYGQPMDGYYASGAGAVAFIRYQGGKPFQVFVGTVSGPNMRGEFYPFGPEGGASAGRLRFEWSGALTSPGIGAAPMKAAQATMTLPVPTGAVAAAAAGKPATGSQSTTPSPQRFSGFTIANAPRIDGIRPGSEASTVAKCPGGKVVSGFAGHSAAPVILGNAYVTEIAPLADGSGFKFTAFNGGVLTPDFVLLAAHCIDRPEGYEIFESSRSLRPQERAIVESVCPAGKLLIGGGTRTGRSVYTAASAPRGDGGAWQAHFRNDRLLGANEQAQVIAICVSDRYAEARTVVASPEMSIGPGALANVPALGCGPNTGLSAGVHSSATTIEHAGPNYSHGVPTGPSREWSAMGIKNVEAERAVVGVRALCGGFM